MNISSNFPRIIWIMWWQGFEKAPRIVQQCIRSWRKNNPDWELVFLDQESVNNYLTLDYITNLNENMMPLQALSDVIRINLLAKYGGVWVDATCFCCKPLNEWLDRYIKSGFFAFSNPGPGRLIASWFLAAENGSYIICQLADSVNKYWSINVLTPANKIVAKNINRIISYDYRVTPVWFSWFFFRYLKVYPYFWLHYKFNQAFCKNRVFRENWNSSEKYHAGGPLILKRLRKIHDNDSLESFFNEIDRIEVPVYKLNWRLESFGSNKDFVLERLFSVHND
ncbi:MAG: capsular polysaccharide synthesis protein [Methylococcales bacterium]